jgi:phosphoribulokinase
MYPSPVFRSLGAAFEEGKFRTIIHNIGEAGKFNALDIEPGSFQLASKFPEVINAGDSLFLEGVYTGMEPKASGKLKIESLTKDLVTYDFRVYGSQVYISLERQ